MSTVGAEELGAELSGTALGEVDVVGRTVVVDDLGSVGLLVARVRG